MLAWNFYLLFWQRVTSSQRLAESSVLDTHTSEVSSRATFSFSGILIFRSIMTLVAVDIFYIYCASYMKNSSLFLSSDQWWTILVLWIPCAQVTHQNCKYLIYQKYLCWKDLHTPVVVNNSHVTCRLKSQIFIGTTFLQQLNEKVGARKFCYKQAAGWTLMHSLLPEILF